MENNREKAEREYYNAWQKRILDSRAYKGTERMATIGDKYHLEPLIGLIPGGIGDMSSILFGIPSLYLSMAVVRSYSLSVVVLSNILIDVLVGLVPYLGILFDVLKRANLKNYRLIRSYVLDEPGVRRSVKSRALLITIVVVLLLVLIVVMLYFVIKWAVEGLDWFGEQLKIVFAQGAPLHPISLTVGAEALELRQLQRADLLDEMRRPLFMLMTIHRW